MRFQRRLEEPDVCPDSPTDRPKRLAFTAFLTAYFFYFSWDTLRVHFAPDDMMNMAIYWRMKPLQLVFAQFLPWRGFYRPLAGLFYVPILHLFGLNPAPYHAVVLLVLLANVFLIWRLARLLGCTEAAGGLTALVACYHAGLSNLNYNIAFVYDVLCCFFYVAALVYYTGLRQRGNLPAVRHIAAFFGLYLCALNAKEMAVTLPLVLLAYEWLYHRPTLRNWRDLLRWLAGPGRTALAAAALNVAYLYGKLLRPDSLAHDPAYRPVFSLARVQAFQIRFFSDLWERWDYFGWSGIVAVWLLLFYLAWRRDRPVLRFCWIFLVVTPLPIEFLEGRAGATLYVPFAAWAIFVSVVFVDVARTMGAFLAGEPFMRRLGPNAMFGAALLTGASLWAYQNQDLKQGPVKYAMQEEGKLTWHVIGEFQRLRPRVPPHTRVVFLNDPFVDWDMAFIAELWFQDRTVDIKLLRKTPLTADEIASAQSVFDYREDRLLRVR